MAAKPKKRKWVLWFFLLIIAAGGGFAGYSSLTAPKLIIKPVSQAAIDQALASGLVWKPKLADIPSVPLSQLDELAKDKTLLAASYVMGTDTPEYLAKYGSDIDAARHSAWSMIRGLEGKYIEVPPQDYAPYTSRIIGVLPTIFYSEAALSRSKGDVVGWMDAISNDFATDKVLKLSPGLLDSRYLLETKLANELMLGLEALPLSAANLREIYGLIPPAASDDPQAANEICKQFQYELVPLLLKAGDASFWDQRLLWKGPRAGEFDGPADLDKAIGQCKTAFAATSASTWAPSAPAGSMKLVSPARGWETSFPDDSNPWNAFWLRRAFYSRVMSTPNFLGEMLMPGDNSSEEYVIAPSFRLRTMMEALRLAYSLKVYRVEHGGKLPDAIGTGTLPGPTPRNLYRGGSFEYDAAEELLVVVKPDEEMQAGQPDPFQKPRVEINLGKPHSKPTPPKPKWKLPAHANVVH